MREISSLSSTSRSSVLLLAVAWSVLLLAVGQVVCFVLIYDMKTDLQHTKTDVQEILRVLKPQSSTVTAAFEVGGVHGDDSMCLMDNKGDEILKIEGVSFPFLSKPVFDTDYSKSWQF